MRTLSIGSRMTMAFAALCAASLIGACTVDAPETEASPGVDEENVGTAEQTIDYGWTPFTSEEYIPVFCDGGSLMNKFQCAGRYCDNIRAYCDPAGAALGGSKWSNFFSEEGTNYAFCDPGHWVTGLDCADSYCDAVRLQCSHVANIEPINCYWTGWISEENGGTLDFGEGYYMRGAQCSGSYCDNMSFHVCQAAPVAATGCSAATCGGAGSGCWCDAECASYGDCCPNACDVCGAC